MYVFIAILCFLGGVASQENAGSSVANSLRECYNNTEFAVKDRRLPSTINVLIELIRKVEDGPSSQDARQLSYQLIHRFRQDGIVKSKKTTSSQFSLPYSPIGKQSDKNRILLQKLTPGSAVNFPNSTLNALERCSLHFMLSNTIELAMRGDESFVCGKLAKYKRRTKRDVNEDVEIFEPNRGPPIGAMQENPEEAPPEEGGQENDVETVENNNPRWLSPKDISDCPVESGVVYTKWGAIQAGTVIAGIAAGYEKQEINTRVPGVKVDSRFGATLAGDLSEAALHQGSVNDHINVGAPGGWNSTLVPRWYFINQKEDWEMTDADIRAGLDGLILALNIDSWKGSASNLKVSQILDMYYSPRGVFNSTIRACNRKNLQTTVAPSDVLKKETHAFNDLLDVEAKLKGTIISEGLMALGENAVESFLKYLPSMNDLSCTLESDVFERASTDILIVLDTAWPYRTIYPALSYLLDNLDVNKFDSNYIIVNAMDFRTIVNSSRSILDFHENYNESIHRAHPTGTDFTKTYTSITTFMQAKFDNETNIGGRSLITLLVPYTSNINEQDKYYISQRKELFKQQLPDLRLLVLGSGSKDIYADLVYDSTYDVFSLSDTTDSAIIKNSIDPVVDRVKQIPRRIINPNCKSDWSGSSSTGTQSLDLFVEPGSVNYYRVAPNYFFSGDQNRQLKVRGQGYGTVIVCYSKSVVRPRQNDTTSTDMVCEIVTANEITINLNDHCSGYSLISECPPLYFSVDASSTRVTSYRCTDSRCRFPNNIRYTVSAENFGCQSGSMRIFGSFILIAFVFILLRF